MCCTLKSGTQLRKVKAVTDHEDTTEAKLFKEEVQFYTYQKSAKAANEKAFSKRMKSCDNQHMFENLLKSVEEKDHNKNMPVRMFYRNTFGNLVNDAIFALKKKQSKE